MTKILRYFSLTLFFTAAIISLILPGNVLASENPQNYPNNKYGIHIIDENDLEDAAKLVNSSGGDWGYVTFVIREDERITKRWQDVFDKMRRLHLIPIIRIASRQESYGWKKLEKTDVDNWISFFNSLNWVVKNRYIIVGNEPNHSEEWGGEINPEEYSNYLLEFCQKIKSTSTDYFILPAAMDSVAGNTKTTMTADVYLKKMIDANNNIFESIDGWNSHSYPLYSKKGQEIAEGKGSVKSYQWELNLLKEYGVNKDFPVFITETGWKQNIESNSSSDLTSDQIQQEIKNKNDNVWNDKRIVAITPFLLNYQSKPFNIFSWKKADGSFYNFAKTYQEILKIKGKPAQEVDANIITFILPPIFYSNNQFTGIVLIKNTGQSIFDGTEKIYKKRKYFDYILEPKVIKSEIEPTKNAFATVKISFHKQSSLI